MPSVRGLSWLVMLLPGATACGGLASDQATSRAPDSGSFGGPRDGSGTTGAEATAGRSQDSGPRVGTSLGDAGTVPPDFCVPPCVWRALVRCMPPPARVCHEVAPPEPGSRGVTCDPDSGWFTTRLDQFSAGVTVTYGHGSKACFGVHFGGKAPSGLRTVTNGTTIIATYGLTTPVHCEDDQKDYALDPTNPVCKPWTGDGNRVVVPALACESTVTGPCDGVP